MNQNTHNMQPVESSQIAEIGHHEPSSTLRIKFKPYKGQAEGATYEYLNFTADDFAAFQKVESFGRHFGANIKGNAKHPFKKL